MKHYQVKNTLQMKKFFELCVDEVEQNKKFKFFSVRCIPICIQVSHDLK